MIVSELSEARKAKALSTGVADHVLDPSTEDVVARVLEITDGRGADVCFECSSVNAVLDQLFAAVKPGGVVVNVSIWSKPATDRHAGPRAQGDRPARHHRLLQTTTPPRSSSSRTARSTSHRSSRRGSRSTGSSMTGSTTLIHHKETAVKILVHP